MKLTCYSSPTEIAEAEAETKEALCRYTGWGPSRVTVKILIRQEPDGTWDLDFEIKLDGDQLTDEDVAIVSRFFDEAVIVGDSAPALLN